MRAGARAGILSVMVARHTILELSIESGSDPISGSFALAGEPPRNFNGWIELTAAIEAARGESNAPWRSPDSGDEDLRQASP